MKYRNKVNRRKSKRLFTKTAMRVKRNNYRNPMRGGYRL